MCSLPDYYSMKLTKNTRKVLLIFVLALFISSCEIQEPSLPVWDVDLNIPFTSDSYNIFDIIKRNSNVGFDSLNNDLVFIYGESNYKRSFGEDIKFDGIKTTEIKAAGTFRLDTSIVFDDSTFVTRTEFLNGNLKFNFINSSADIYSVNAVIKNLFRVIDNDTARINSDVSPGEVKLIELNLSEYYIKNETADNKLRLSIIFNSSEPVPVNFNYTLSEYSVKLIEGRLKPLNTGQTYDEVLDPFGSDVPEGEINFASVSPNKNFFVANKFSDIYQVDFTHLSIVGENKNGHRVRLKYYKDGKHGTQLDSIFSLTLPSGLDSISFPINEDNSNILEFINNVPKKIEVKRVDVLNLSYEEGTVNYTDSISLKLVIQMPLDISITKPIIFRDTADAGIDDEEQRNNLDDARHLQFTFKSANGFPLKGVAKLLVLDSFFTPLLAITKIVGNQSDSSVIINSAGVGDDGYVTNINTNVFNAELDSAQIQKLKSMGKIIYEYKLFTDPNAIPPPGSTVKIRGTDRVRIISFGKITYRINSDN